MAIQDTLQVRLERRFDASFERVFEAWLDPAVLRHWMFGPATRDEEIVRLTLDPRVGGSFAYVIRRHEEEITHVGRYLHINRPRRLVFTWGIVGQSEEQSRVIVDLLPVGGGCELTLTHEMRQQAAHAAARTEACWDQAFDRLVLALAQ
jgi:uncharacterized protein YndB with AHSA1/START domain